MIETSMTSLDYAISVTFEGLVYIGYKMGWGWEYLILGASSRHSAWHVPRTSICAGECVCACDWVFPLYLTNLTLLLQLLLSIKLN